MAIGAYIIKLPNGYYYIGSSGNLELRKIDHFSKLKCGIHPTPKLQQEYCAGDEIVMEVFLTDTRDAAYNLEQKMISEQWNNPLLCNRTQAVRPGDWFKTDECRKAQSERLRDVPLTEEHRNRITQAKTGSKHTEKTKNKMSLQRKGNTKSPEWSDKIAEATRMKIEVDGIIYNSATEAGQANGTSVKTTLNRARSKNPLFSSWKIVESD